MEIYLVYEFIYNNYDEDIEEGINFFGLYQNEEEAKKVAGIFNKLFNFPIKDGNSAVFASTGVEVRKQMFLGKNGHIAIKTNYMDRAMAYIEAMGGSFNMEKGVAKDENGSIKAIYLNEDFGGFAVHLVQK